jgi:hypothetical protein
MATYTGRGKVPTRWAVLVLGAAVAAALSMMAVPAGALTPVRESGEASDLRVASAGPTLPPGPGQSIGEPRYTVELVGFRALDESGYDWNGSDEVFGLFSATGGYSVRTVTQGDVDTGTGRVFGRQERCLTRQRVLAGGPDRGWLMAPDGTRWECDPRGVPAPIGLLLELLEDDNCNPFFPSCFNSYSPQFRDPADDLIGRATPTFSASELASRLPHVGDAWATSFTLGGPCGHQPPGHVCGTSWFSSTGPEYRLVIIIRRVNDARPVATE